MKTNIIKRLLLPALISLAVISCGDDVEPVNTPGTIKAKVIEVGSVDVPKQIEYSGKIEGTDRVKLSTKLMGNITYMPFEIGAEVKKGDVLAKISSKDLVAKKEQVKANIAQAEAALKNMEINYNRVKSLHEKGSATQKELEDITMAYDMTKAQVNAAREMENEINDVLSYSVIKSPFNGYIVNKFYELGDLTAPGYPLFIVENFCGFVVNSQVSAKDINSFQVGDSIKVLVDELGDKEFIGHISAVSAGAHPATRQYEVKIEMKAKAEDGIKSGMYAKVILENAKDNIITVDKNHLVKQGQLVGVYALGANNNTVLRWLRIGKDLGNKVEVLSGLNVGDKIVADTKNVSEGLIVEGM